MALKSLRKIKIEMPCPPKIGEIVEGKIIIRDKNSLFLDLGAKGIGIIYGKELFEAKDVLKNLKIGDTLFSKVINLETEDGYRELSLIEARYELTWKELARIKETEETFEAQVHGANKGGMVCQIKGISAFLPTSQLLPEHYPKVKNGEGAKIASALQKFVGKKLKVKIFDINPGERKLILSEKAAKKERVEAKSMNCKVGDIIEGEISGVTSFGAFLRFGENLEGLIHVSEIPTEAVEDSDKVLKIGQKLKAKIIKIMDNRIYLSLKNI